MNVAVEAPDGTVTDAGTVPTWRFEDCRATVNPPVGAGPERVTVPVDGVPPITLVGLKVTPVKTGAVIVRTAVAEAPFAVAVMVEVASEATPTVVTVKVVLVAPAGTVTDPGTVAAPVFELCRVTIVPDEPAGPARVTVPVLDVPPTTVVGLSVTPLTPAVVTVRVPVRFTVPSVPVTVTGVLLETAVVVAENVAWLSPTVTVTVAGTVTLGSLDFRATTVPPAGAWPDS